MMRQLALLGVDFGHEFRSDVDASDNIITTLVNNIGYMHLIHLTISAGDDP